MKWRITWTVWIALIVGSFAAIEGMAFATEGGVTLSRYLWELSQAWPPLPWLIGNITGGFAVHLWWRWSPDDPHDKRG